MCAETTGPAGLHPHTNPHWRPQRFMCNLEKFLPAYNFVGSFDHLKEHAEKLLRGLGLWDDYGSSGWTRAKRSPMMRGNPRAQQAEEGGAIFEHNGGPAESGFATAFKRRRPRLRCGCSRGGKSRRGRG